MRQVWLDDVQYRNAVAFAAASATFYAHQRYDMIRLAVTMSSAGGDTGGGGGGGSDGGGGGDGGGSVPSSGMTRTLALWRFALRAVMTDGVHARLHWTATGLDARRRARHA